MAIPDEFGYEKPTTINDAVNILADKGKMARILAGGTDVANEIKQGFRVPEILIDIKSISALEKIELTEDKIKIGALATFNDIRKSKLIFENVYILYEAAGLVASYGLRNRATVIGNICSAVACMDSAAPLLVHDATVHCISVDGEREVPIHEWFVDNKKTAIKENEMVTHLSIPIPKIKYAGAYQKMMRYSGEDLAQANVGVLLFADETCKLAFGSVGPIPVRSHKLETHFQTNGFTKKSIAEAKDMLDNIIKPITDIRSSKQYRMHVTKVMLERAINTAAERLKQPKLITK